MYTKDHISIIASISEHQPIAWSSFMFDYHILPFFFLIVYLISAIAIFISMKNLATWIHNKPKSPSIIVIKGPSNLKASAKVLVDQPLPFQRKGAGVFLSGVLYLLTSYVTFCSWVTLEAYSSPFIVLAARGTHGDKLQQNTPPDAKVMSWWDYGYQIIAMGNRTVIVDNITLLPLGK